MKIQTSLFLQSVKLSLTKSVGSEAYSTKLMQGLWLAASFPSWRTGSAPSLLEELLVCMLQKQGGVSRLSRWVWGISLWRHSTSPGHIDKTKMMSAPLNLPAVSTAVPWRYSPQNRSNLAAVSDVGLIVAGACFDRKQDFAQQPASVEANSRSVKQWFLAIKGCLDEGMGMWMLCVCSTQEKRLHSSKRKFPTAVRSHTVH